MSAHGWRCQTQLDATSLPASDHRDGRFSFEAAVAKDVPAALDWTPSAAGLQD